MRGKRGLPASLTIFIAIIAVLSFSLFPFVQILSISLKYQFDWGNPSLIPVKLNLGAYKELLGLSEKHTNNIQDSIKRLLDNPDITKTQREKILEKYRSTGDVFPFIRYFLNSFMLSGSAAFI